MDINQPLEQVLLDKANSLKSKVFAQIRLIITFLLMLALLFIILVQVDAKSKLDDDFWLKFVVGLFLNVAMLVIWTPSGKESGERNESYKANKKLASEKISIILSSTEKTNHMDEFCKHMNTINREVVTRSMLTRRGIKYDEYLDMYSLMSIVEIKKHKLLTRKQKRVTISIKQGIKVDQIYSSQITSLSNNAGEIFSVRNEEKSAQATKTAIKITSCIVMAVVIAYMAFARQDKITLASFAQFFIWVGTMVFNIFTCHQMGYGLVTIQRNSYHLRLIDFCARYDAWLENNKNK